MPAKDTTAQPSDHVFSLISDEKLLALYAALLKCRMISRRMGSGHAQREASIAAAVGVAIDLLAGDTLAASGSGTFARFVKGASLPRILAHIRSGKRTTHAAAVKAAVKTALQKVRMNKGGKGAKIAVAFCDDAAAPAQIWRESLREAASKRLPILFVCCASTETDDIESLAPKSRFPIIVVDSNDVVAIYRVASESIAHARRGNGPTLMVCRPWPLTTAAHDPILNMERYLTRKRLFTPQFKARTLASFARELRAAKRVESKN
jgi:TPP-dependent pyruvate/acetoin dehydrogenase alpha subunit